MKKSLVISSVLFGVVFLAGCGQQSVNQTQPTIPEMPAQTPTPAIDKPVAACQNFPPPSFCPSGISDVIVIGTDKSGCQLYGCKSDTK